MKDEEFERLQSELQSTHNHHEQLQELYKTLTGRRWLPQLKLIREKCVFCGEAYFHKSGCDWYKHRNEIDQLKKELAALRKNNATS